MSRGEINVDPVHDEFFKAQDLADALVREAIQNSLDARRGRATVRVRFRLVSGEGALTPDAAAPYLHGLFQPAQCGHAGSSVPSSQRAPSLTRWATEMPPLRGLDGPDDQEFWWAPVLHHQRRNQRPETRNQKLRHLSPGGTSSGTAELASRALDGSTERGRIDRRVAEKLCFDRCEEIEKPAGIDQVSVEHRGDIAPIPCVPALDLR
jgi:hypothetical protein